MDNGLKKSCHNGSKRTADRGAETRGGMGGYIPETPNSLRMVHICIPLNNSNGCTFERKFGEKSVLF